MKDCGRSSATTDSKSSLPCATDVACANVSLDCQALKLRGWVGALRQRAQVNYRWADWPIWAECGMILVVRAAEVLRLIIINLTMVDSEVTSR
jgi:hypothetical protein